MAGTPQQRTRDNLTARGYLVGTVEKKKKFPDKKKSACRACGNQPMIEISSDLWEVFDVVAVHPQVREIYGDEDIREGLGMTWGRPGVLDRKTGKVSPQVPEYRVNILFVQTTSAANHASRRNKILASMEAKLVLLSGARILLQSWKQPDGPGGRWVPRDEWITISMYDQAPHYPSTVAELMEIKRRAKQPDLPPGSTLPLSPDLGEEVF